jgi:hypothetical protein
MQSLSILEMTISFFTVVAPAVAHAYDSNRGRLGLIIEV